MAWENFIGGNDLLGEGGTCGLVDATLFANEYPTGNPNQGQYIPNASISSTIVLGDLRINANPTRTITLSVGSIQTTYYSSVTPAGGQFKILSGSSEALSCSPKSTYWEGDKPYLVCGIDEENHLGKVGLLFRYQTGAPGGFTDWVCFWTPNEKDGEMYYWLKSNIAPLITYQWSSVPTISGKNGILSLATLKSSKINDGEAVSDGSASDFSSLPSSSKISVLVAAVMPEDPGNKTSVVITYHIGSLESGEYTSAKVAAKKNSIPESLEDADVVMDIPAESGKYSVGSLEELTKYYFVIFVADSNGNNATSNPESIRTGEVPAPFRETVEVLKQIRENEFTSVYEWTGKWGKPDDASITNFVVEAQEVLDITESATETHFTVEHNETNFISENVETEIVLT